MFKEPNDYYFGRPSQGQQSKYNWTNTAIAVEKSSKSLEKAECDQMYFIKNFCKTFHKIHQEENLVKSLSLHRK